MNDDLSFVVNINSMCLDNSEIFISNIDKAVGNSKENIDNKVLLNETLVLPESLEYFQKVLKQLICSICEELIIDPVSCQTCSNAYCRKCLTNYMNNNKSCPLDDCNPIEITEEIEKSLKNKLEKIKIKCFYNCGNNNLTMYEYGKHLEKCKEESSETLCWLCNIGKIKTKDLKFTKEDYDNYNSLIKELSDEKTKNELLEQKLNNKSDSESNNSKECTNCEELEQTITELNKSISMIEDQKYMLKLKQEKSDQDLLDSKSEIRELNCKIIELKDVIMNYEHEKFNTKPQTQISSDSNKQDLNKQDELEKLLKDKNSKLNDMEKSLYNLKYNYENIISKIKLDHESAILKLNNIISSSKNSNTNTNMDSNSNSNEQSKTYYKKGKKYNKQYEKSIIENANNANNANNVNIVVPIENYFVVRPGLNQINIKEKSYDKPYFTNQNNQKIIVPNNEQKNNITNFIPQMQIQKTESNIDLEKEKEKEKLIKEKEKKERKKLKEKEKKDLKEKKENELKEKLDKGLGYMDGTLPVNQIVNIFSNICSDYVLYVNKLNFNEVAYSVYAVKESTVPKDILLPRINFKIIPLETHGLYQICESFTNTYLYADKKIKENGELMLLANSSNFWKNTKAFKSQTAFSFLRANDGSWRIMHDLTDSFLFFENYIKINLKELVETKVFLVSGFGTLNAKCYFKIKSK